MDGCGAGLLQLLLPLEGCGGRWLSPLLECDWDCAGDCGGAGGLDGWLLCGLFGGGLCCEGGPPARPPGTPLLPLLPGPNGLGRPCGGCPGADGDDRNGFCSG
ncbi:hypothetical protein GCM10010522_02390 [Kribbella solani]